uniref:Nodulin-like domain-containing protein n=1 Tax=Chenopodium quinoa TaxID=63459 RepID=A0A803M1C9_CHEQI
MLALLPTTVTFSLMCLVKICPASGCDDKRHLNRFSLIALILAVFLMIIIILENVLEFPKWARLFALVVLLLLLGSPLRIALEAIGKGKCQTLLPEKEPLSDSIYLHESDEFVGEKAYNELSSTLNNIPPPAEENIDIMKAMQSFNFWLLFVSMSCGMGSGLATINNLSQIGQTLGYDTVKINTLVSLWSIWNFLGRFGAGYISDILLRQKGWTRPLMVAITQATMIAGHLVISSGFSGNLYIGTTLVGICYGAQWSLMPTITAEIFGVQHMGTIFNTIGIASPVGTYILSVWVIGHIYDKQAGEDNTCYGVQCFMVSFFILAFISLLGFLIALTLFFRTKAFYQSVVLRRLRFL